MARQKVLHEEFVFHTREPSLSYGFGVQPDRALIGIAPFEEREAVHFVTECVFPLRFRGREGRAIIYPEPVLLDHNGLAADDVRRKWIGHIRATKSVFETAIWLPPTACWRLSEAMASGLVRSMLGHGPVEPRGMHRVRSVSFYGPEFDPVAYVG